MSGTDMLLLVELGAPIDKSAGLDGAALDEYRQQIFDYALASMQPMCSERFYILEERMEDPPEGSDSDVVFGGLDPERFRSRLSDISQWPLHEALTHADHAMYSYVKPRSEADLAADPRVQVVARDRAWFTIETSNGPKRGATSGIPRPDGRPTYEEVQRVWNDPNDRYVERGQIGVDEGVETDESEEVAPVPAAPSNAASQKDRVESGDFMLAYHQKVAIEAARGRPSFFAQFMSIPHQSSKLTKAEMDAILVRPQKHALVYVMVKG